MPLLAGLLPARLQVDNGRRAGLRRVVAVVALRTGELAGLRAAVRRELPELDRAAVPVGQVEVGARVHPL